MRKSVACVISSHSRKPVKNQEVSEIGKCCDFMSKVGGRTTGASPNLYS